jgi:hypothetical protein
MLYNDLRWEVAQAIIERYSIDYIFYGDTERFGTSEQAAYVPPEKRNSGRTYRLFVKLKPVYFIGCPQK